jgi:hypothetical protein
MVTTINDIVGSVAGLVIRTFKGSITKDKNKPSEKEYPFQYRRIVLPWSKTKADIFEVKPVGLVPTFELVMSWCKDEGIDTEIPLTSKGESTGKPSVVQFLVDGINQYENHLASSAVMNTREAAKAAVVAKFAKMQNLTHAEAIAILATAFLSEEEGETEDQ